MEGPGPRGIHPESPAPEDCGADPECRRQLSAQELRASPLSRGLHAASLLSGSSFPPAELQQVPWEVSSARWLPWDQPGRSLVADLTGLTTHLASVSSAEAAAQRARPEQCKRQKCLWMFVFRSLETLPAAI